MTVHSKDGTTWLTKLDRISALTSDCPSIVFNNIGHIIDHEMLCNAYHQLDGNKAAGVDRKSKVAYGEELDENLSQLLKKLRRGTYTPQPARIVEIPKEDGSKRPLAISCIEDKIVQSVVHQILSEIYEPIFSPASYGGRPGRGAHDALRALTKFSSQCPKGAIVEIDIQKYFNSIPHEEMMKCIEEKISDRRFLGLVKTLLQSPYLEDGRAVKNVKGCPQGSIASPILANIYLHKVIDEWFSTIRQTHIQGIAQQVRYLDDMVFVFQRESEAERFYKVLPKRLEKFGLKLHEKKSSLIKAGSIHAQKANTMGRKLPTFNFLGFTAYWGKARNGRDWRLKYTSRADRFSTKLKELRNYLWKRLATNDRGYLLWRIVKVIRGWINYHGISDNKRRVQTFILYCKRLLFRWFNRRGGRRRLTWERYVLILKRVRFPESWKTISMFTKRAEISSNANRAIGSRMR